jgi:hypothetical protein
MTTLHEKLLAHGKTAGVDKIPRIIVESLFY